ncbi:radical SAM family heme chaperone HemW [Gammaproteobacteria bacterium]|nr:radical SAM family heme chaperone HemW [Gammaproteobacteria bacterium]
MTKARQDRLFFRDLPPLSLYIHIPWCERMCPYCDFNSHPRKGPLPESTYIAALLADLDQELPRIRGRKLRSIFIGGGTPSLLSAESVDSMLAGIRARIGYDADIEITMEANPDSSESRKFAEFRSAGVNRLSIGVQSFNDKSLRNIGRVHDGMSARHAVSAAISAGFDNFNLDLMYALPGQQIDVAVADINTALSFDPPHLSCYQLTIEPNTAFNRQPPVLPDEDAGWQMQSSAEDILRENGYVQYEVSAYAKNGRTCRHNLNYWQFGDYVGIGAGAHSKVTRNDEIIRTWKIKHPAAYLKKAHTTDRVGGTKSLSPEEIRFEFMLNALRLRQPVSTVLFQQHTGQPIARMKSQLAKAEADGFLQFDGNNIATTSFGRRFLNDLLQQFLPGEGPHISSD